MNVSNQRYILLTRQESLTRKSLAQRCYVDPLPSFWSTPNRTLFTCQSRSLLFLLLFTSDSRRDITSHCGGVYTLADKAEAAVHEHMTTITEAAVTMGNTVTTAVAATAPGTATTTTATTTVTMTAPPPRARPPPPPPFRYSILNSSL